MTSNASADTRSARWVRQSVGISSLVVPLVILVVLPIGMVLLASVLDTPIRPGQPIGSFTFEWFSRLNDAAFWTSLRNSVQISIASTIVALAIGGTLAWLAARTDFPAKSLIHLAGIVPLFIPTLIAALAWSFMASPRQGFLNIIFRDLGIPLQANIYSLAGIVFVLGLNYAPYTYLIILGSMNLANPELEEAALVHGANQRSVIRHVTIPLVTPAIFGSSLLIFALAIENFPVPQILGAPGRVLTLPSYIYRIMHTDSPLSNLAAAIGVVMIVLLACVLYFQRRYLAGRDYTIVGGKGVRAGVVKLGRWRPLAIALVVTYLMLAVVLPFLALLQMAFREQPFIASAANLVNPDELGLRHFSQVLGSSVFVDALVNTFYVAIAVAVGGVALSLAMAFVSLRSQSPMRRVISYLGLAPVAVPPLVLGFAFLWTWFKLPLPLYGTITIIVLAFIVRFLPQSFTGLSASLRQIHKELDEAAQVSGASRLRAAIEITLPLMRSSIAASVMFLLVLSFHEVSVAVFLYTARTRILSIQVYHYWESGIAASAAALAIIYSAVLLIIVALGRRWLVSAADETGIGTLDKA